MSTENKGDFEPSSTPLMGDLVHVLPCDPHESLSAESPQSRAGAAARSKAALQWSRPIDALIKKTTEKGGSFMTFLVSWSKRRHWMMTRQRRSTQREMKMMIEKTRSLLNP